MTDPDPLDLTASTMTQVGLYGQALVRCLLRDPRIQHAYTEWREKHGLVLGALDTAAFESAKRDKAQDIAALGQLLRDDLRLDYRWLAPLLLFAWGVNVVTGSDGVELIPQDVGLPTGRGPRNQGQHIARDVEWFYRAKVQVPRTTAYALAKEDQTRKLEAGTQIAINPSVVRAGIKRAERYLAVLHIDEPN